MRGLQHGSVQCSEWSSVRWGWPQRSSDNRRDEWNWKKEINKSNFNMGPPKVTQKVLKHRYWNAKSTVCSSLYHKKRAILLYCFHTCLKKNIAGIRANLNGFARIRPGFAMLLPANASACNASACFCLPANWFAIRIDSQNELIRANPISIRTTPNANRSTLCNPTLHSITQHNTTLHYTTLHYITLHCTTLRRC